MRNKENIVRILIADVSQFFREKMKQLIADNFDSILISEVSSEQGVLNEIKQQKFDVMILDIELLDGNGLHTLLKIKSVKPEIPVLVMSMFPVKQYEESAFKAGAHGYLSKVNMSNELILALHQIIEGKIYFTLSQQHCKYEEFGRAIDDAGK